MSKAYIFAGVGLVAIVLGLFVWKNQTKITDDTKQQQQKTGITPIAMKKQYTSAPAMTIDSNKTYIATIVTDKGEMKVTLFAHDAPITVNNFVFLAREGFYNDTIFHRVIKGFMIQGGDPLGTGTGSPGYRFADEPVTREY